MTNAYYNYHCIIITTAFILSLNLCQYVSSFNTQPKTSSKCKNKLPSNQHLHFLSSTNAESSTSLESNGEEKDENMNEIDMEMLEHVADDVFSADKRPIILFDGICNLCNSAVNFALDYDSIGKI